MQTPYFVSRCVARLIQVSAVSGNTVVVVRPPVAVGVIRAPDRVLVVGQNDVAVKSDGDRPCARVIHGVHPKRLAEEINGATGCSGRVIVGTHCTNATVGEINQVPIQPALTSQQPDTRDGDFGHLPGARTNAIQLPVRKLSGFSEENTAGAVCEVSLPRPDKVESS